MRNRYLPRSVPGSLLHDVKGLRGGLIGGIDIGGVGERDFRELLPLRGEMESKYLVDFGATNLPSDEETVARRRCRRGADSGAGSNSQRSPKSSSRGGLGDFLAGMVENAS